VIDIHYVDVLEIDDLHPEQLSVWLSETVYSEGYVLGSVTLIFCSDAYLLDINRNYLSHDYYTDIITFDYCEGSYINGDLFVSVERVSDNAILLNQSFLTELRRVCVHGLLHLCGYSDKTEEDAVRMRSKEDYYLNTYVSRET
jgi:probable rRNA maturation factor